VRRRLIGLLAGPILIAQCGPTQCAPETPAPAPTTVETVPPPPPPPPPPPASTSYSFLASASGRYTHWTRCSDPITYQIDTATWGAPSPDERAAIGRALADATAATGHAFSYVGDGGATRAAGVDAVIGLEDFGAGTLGQGGGAYNGAMEMVRGSVYVDVGLAPDLLYATLLHEIAHLLGLGHVTDPTQLMYAYVRQVSATPPRFLQAYQPGDAEGLRLVGTTVQPAECLSTLRVQDDEPLREVVLD